MGSEMCIRDRFRRNIATEAGDDQVRFAPFDMQSAFAVDRTNIAGCLLYTSDAADERSSVDLGGRRIIKKKRMIHESTQRKMKKST